MAPVDPKTNRWLWYATETSDCVPLDPRAYPAMPFRGEMVPRPEWVCGWPDGGRHEDARFRQIDIEVACSPSDRDEVSWVCDYGLTLVAHSWLSEIQDLIDPRRIDLGLVRQNGEIVDGWSTIHEYRPPTLLATEGSTKTCPTCGCAYTVLHGREFFSDETVLGRPLILNSNGIFIREDLARARNLRTPRGAFEPGLVEFETSSQ